MPKWIEVLSSDEKKIQSLAESLSINPLAIEDCQHRDQRPKLDDYETHQLLVWFMFAENKIYELQFLIFSDSLVVVPHDSPPSGNSWESYLKITQSHKDVWHLLYQAIDRLTDVTWQELRSLYAQIDGFEQDLFSKEINPQKLIRYKKQLNRIEYSVGHHSSVASQLRNVCRPQDDLEWKLRDLKDHCERIDRSIGLYRSQIASTIDLYWGISANRTNKQIKKLSILASVSVPLTFWSAFWGMNFEVIPFGQAELFYWAIGVMVVSVLFVGWFLVKQGYWNN